MYKYLRTLMDLADQIGEVDDLFMGEWGNEHKILRLEGIKASGKRFKLTLEVGKDGN